MKIDWTWAGLVFGSCILMFSIICLLFLFCFVLVLFLLFVFQSIGIGQVLGFKDLSNKKWLCSGLIAMWTAFLTVFNAFTLNYIIWVSNKICSYNQCSDMGYLFCTNVSQLFNSSLSNKLIALDTQIPKIPLTVHCYSPTWLSEAGFHAGFFVVIV